MEPRRTGPYRTQGGYLFWRDRYPNGERKTVLVHRELAAKMLGRPLRSDEHVHHRNHIPWDNRLENLEVLPASVHLRRHSRPKEYVTIVCPMCGKTATLLASEVRRNRKQGKKGPFCGKSCAGRWSHIKTWPLEPPTAA
jgi:hypothetical protein